ncbi:MAG: hypothetical protein A2075_15610 [Geobacteraceae bacterium GWC2_58_44]|nr:MAG: hypothetical protein A2075_15610 [Geobacteraceae bacterium GWC2_58_44]HBG06011.1 hypothetical protein [Geobacter sp.]
MTNSYSFHGMVGITVDQGRLQLGSYYDHYMRLLRQEGPLPRVQYQVKEYDAFVLPPSFRNVSGLYLGTADGVCLPQERYAVTCRDGVLTEYTDAPNRATNMWLQWLLLEREVTLVHGAGCSLNGKGFAFPAFGGAGKTMLIGALRRDADFRFFGDDFVALDSAGTMYAYPSDFSIYEQHLELFPELGGTVYGDYFYQRERRRWVQEEWYRLPGNPLLRQIALRLTRGTDPGTLGPAFPPLPGWDQDYVKVPVTEVLPLQSIGTSVPLKASLMLSRYDGTAFRIEKLAPQELVRRVGGILEVEFRYGRIYRDLFSAFGLVDGARLARLQHEVCAAAFSRAELYEVLVPSSFTPEAYTEQMIGVLQEMAR